MRVYIAAFGSGMGHASRMDALAKDLVAEGHKVSFSSSGEVTGWLRSEGYDCNEIPLVDVVFTPQGNFSATATLRLSPVILWHFCQQIKNEVANIARFAPDVVLSDSVAASVIASRTVGVRCMAVLNQLRLISSPKTPRTIAKGLTSASVAFGSQVWDLCEQVFVPDLPPPYTISEKNLWGAGEVSSRAKYIGFLTPKQTRVPAASDLLEKWRSERSRKKVFWQVSGPPATRHSFLAKARASAKALGDRFLFVIASGDPTGPTEPVSIPGGYLYGWCDAPRTFMGTCDAVVSRAGHVSISEFIQHAKPSLLVPIQAQTEQIGNAEKARKLGISVVGDEARLSQQFIRESLDALSSGSFSTRAGEIREVSEGYDAVASIRRELDSNPPSGRPGQR